MKKKKQAVRRRWLFRFTIIFGFMLLAATVYAVLPTISLNSPTSFPVDI